MKRILRSIIDFEGSISQENLALNFQRLIDSKVEWERPDDKRIASFCLAYFRQRLEMPSAHTVRDYFTQYQEGGDTEVLERLKEIAVADFYIRTNFAHLLAGIREEQNKIKAIALLRDSHEILTKGKLFKKGREEIRLHGIGDALSHFAQESTTLVQPDYTAKIQGDIRYDGQEVWDEYQSAKVNKGKAWGKFTGLQKIDEVCHGIKKGELWIHAAFPGHLKTSFAANWAYNLVTRYQTNVLYFSLEMPYEQMRRQFYAIHTANLKWAKLGRKPLDYRKIRDGDLSPDEEVFYKEAVDDFCNNPDYCQLIVHSPDRDMSIDDIRLQAELVHKRTELGLIVLDHGQLLVPRKGQRSKDYVIELNSIVRDAKKLALHFNHGERIPVLMLFQINRQGKEEADKHEGKYTVSAIAYANECLAKGTLVHTNRGLVPIEKVQPGHDQVWSRSGWKPVLNRFENGTRPTVTVTTDRGRRVNVTEDHLFRVLLEDGVAWCPAKALTGQYILSGVLAPFPTIYPKLPYLREAKFRKFIDKHGNELRVPVQMTPDLAYLLGAHAGDGSIDVKRSLVKFTGNRKEKSVRQRLEALFMECFGQPLGSSEAPSRAGSFDLVKCNKALTEWFLDIGADRTSGVPEIILGSPRDCVVAYLQGLFDTDGYVSTQGLVTISQKLSHRLTLEHVQSLLSCLGVDSSLSVKVAKLKGKLYPQSILRIRSRKGRAIFASSIGFTEPHKQARLNEFVQMFGSSLKSGTGEIWPVGKTYRALLDQYATERILDSQTQVLEVLSSTPAGVSVIAAKVSKTNQSTWGILQTLINKGLASKTAVGQYIATGPKRVLPRKCLVNYESEGGISRGALEAALETLSDLQDPRLDWLQGLLNVAMPERVVSVEEHEPCMVYDLEVTGDHEYMTGGLFTHNCEKSADVISTSYLNDEHRQNGTTLFCNLKNRDNPHFEPFMAKVDFAPRRIYNLDLYNSGNAVSADEHRRINEILMGV